MTLIRMCFQNDLDLDDLKVSDGQEIKVISVTLSKQLGESCYTFVSELVAVFVSAGMLLASTYTDTKY